jgi:hypothetical protein
MIDILICQSRTITTQIIIKYKNFTQLKIRGYIFQQEVGEALAVDQDYLYDKLAARSSCSELVQLLNQIVSGKDAV